jgi:hypothetical protein
MKKVIKQKRAKMDAHRGWNSRALSRNHTPRSRSLLRCTSGIAATHL